MLDPKKLVDSIGGRNRKILARAAKISAMTLSQLCNPNAAIDPSLSTFENLAAELGFPVRHPLLSEGGPEARLKIKVKRKRGRPRGSMDSEPRGTPNKEPENAQKKTRKPRKRL